jgi:histidine triad (HIT) family protein
VAHVRGDPTMWRHSLADLPLPSTSSCPFCDYLRGTDDAVFVSRGRVTSVLVNPRQYERGALLVIPNQHVSTLIDADHEQFVAVQLEARRMARLLVEQFGATGVDVFQNAGVSAGQTVPHYHVHVVPRYPSGDPATRFLESDYDITPIDQLRAIADALTGPGEALSARHSKPAHEKYPQNPRLWGIMFAGWMLVAFAALARLITAPAIAYDWPRTVPFTLQLAALFVASMATRVKGKRSLIAGYATSLALFAVSVLLTV